VDAEHGGYSRPACSLRAKAEVMTAGSEEEWMDRLNYFAPYESKAPWHEDQLTRAFLVVIRLVPLAQVALLDLVREGQISAGTVREEIVPPLSALPSALPTIDTQVSRISQSSGRPPPSQRRIIERTALPGGAAAARDGADLRTPAIGRLLEVGSPHRPNRPLIL
jgi:hypothetical protein